MATLRRTRFATTAATWLMQNGAPMWDAAGFLGMSEKTLRDVYGHHHPEHLRLAAAAIARPRQSLVISLEKEKTAPLTPAQALEIIGGPGRIRTSNQTVMSGLVSPESADKIDVFRRVRARSFASVHGVSVVNLWSVHRFPSHCAY
jgi:hypothetical protein